MAKQIRLPHSGKTPAELREEDRLISDGAKSKPPVEKVVTVVIGSIFAGLLLSIMFAGLTWVSVSIWQDVLSKF